jgi:hypothetical protein
MADENDEVDTSELDGLTDDDAEQLLADAVAEDDSANKGSGRDEDDGAEQLGDRGKRALDRMKAARKAAEKKAAELEERLNKYENANKSELQRLQEERDKLRESSTKAISEARALRVAMDTAPEHASLAQVRAVAKRVRGEDDDELEADAAELFELLAPAPQESKPKTPSRPKERLRGGSEPDDEVEEDDPRKLAALLPRRR